MNLDDFYLMHSRLKLNHGNFRIEVPENDPTPSHPPIPKDLIDRKAYLLWESRGRPISSPQQQKVVLLIAIGNKPLYLRIVLKLNMWHISFVTLSWCSALLFCSFIKV